MNDTFPFEKIRAAIQGHDIFLPEDRPDDWIFERDRRCNFWKQKRTDPA